MRLTEDEYQRLVANRRTAPSSAPPNHIVDANKKAHRQPNKTESEAGRMLQMEFPNCEVRYEAVTLKMANGHKYTADWCVFGPGSAMMLVEIKARGKNGFRLPSYQRAKLAYDQCKAEFPTFVWRWMEKAGGVWGY